MNDTPEATPQPERPPAPPVPAPNRDSTVVGPALTVCVIALCVLGWFVYDQSIRIEVLENTIATGEQPRRGGRGTLRDYSGGGDSSERLDDLSARLDRVERRLKALER